MFRVFEFGGSGWCIIFITFFQAVAVGWLIGADRFLKYASMMRGRRPVFSVFLKLCWKFIIPLSALVGHIVSIAYLCSGNNGSFQKTMQEQFVFTLAFAVYVSASAYN